MVGARRVFVAVPDDDTVTTGQDRHAHVRDALRDLGFLATFSDTAIHSPTSLDTLIDAVGGDLAALRAADYVVVLPGAEDRPELIWAEAWDKPFLTIADLAEMVAA
ncbi:hypothetical protein [Krasilnikovia sp. MM14-A1259]|uniref:hypothetical protein n=1 Tax=Krasilnikovia sp. MM14-A1259 TaxID=3373539 RepID=UPI00380D3D92